MNGTEGLFYIDGDDHLTTMVVTPYEAEEVLRIDLSGLSIEHSRDVATVFDRIEARARATGRRWYLLFDYTGTRIQSPAWVAWSQRTQEADARLSLGTVRFAPGAETERDLRLRAESRGTRPNIRNTEGEARARITELKEARSDAG